MLWGVVASEATLTALLIQTREPWLFVGIFVAIGFVGGAPLPLKATLTGELFGRANFAGAMGLLQSLATPFQLLIVPIGGYVYTVTGSYASVFLLTIPCFLLGGLPVFLARGRAGRETCPIRRSQGQARSILMATTRRKPCRAVRADGGIRIRPDGPDFQRIYPLFRRLRDESPAYHNEALASGPCPGTKTCATQPRTTRPSRTRSSTIPIPRATPAS